MVYFVHTKCQQDLKKYRDWRWTALACASLNQLQSILMPEGKLSIAATIQDVTDDVRLNFIDFVGQLSNQQRNKKLWYSSCLASKSTSQTDFFHQYVYLKVLERLATQKQDLIVVTDDSQLIRSANQLELSGVKVIPNHVPRRQGSQSWRGVGKFLKYTALWFLLRPFRRKKLDQYQCILHTWIDDRISGTNMKMADPFWGNLETQFLSKGCSVARMAPLWVDPSNIWAANRRLDHLIYPLAYVNLTAVFRSFSAKYDIVCDEHQLDHIKDTKILTYLLKREVRRERGQKNYAVYLLFLEAYQCLGRLLNANATVFYPYENQPWEKMLNLAMPGLKRVGYQHSTIPKNWLDYYTSEYEQSEPHPQAVLSSGRIWTEFLREFNKRLTVNEAGTIRYDYLFQADEPCQKLSQEHDVLISLPISPAVALQLQSRLLELLYEPDARAYTFYVKAHPCLPKRYIRYRDLSEFPNVKIVQTPIQELLTHCTVAVCVDSTVALEAVFAGVKTVNFIPESITLGFEYFIREHSYCATESEFIETFWKAVKAMRGPETDVRRYFTPIDYDVFFQYTEMNPNALN